MATNPASTIVDVAAPVADIASYLFLGAAAGQTVKGFFVDIFGKRAGNSFSLAINQANGTNDALALPTPPAEAVGAIVRFSGKTYFDLATGTTDDFEDNYSNYPFFNDLDGNVPLGRVNN